jgi:Putative restriction endonuclease
MAGIAKRFEPSIGAASDIRRKSGKTNRDDRSSSPDTCPRHAFHAYTDCPGAPMGTLMESRPRRHRITAEEYHRMAEVGLLAPDARVELVEGEIIDMAPIGSRHMSVVDRLTRLFDAGLGQGDNQIRIPGHSRLRDNELLTD